MEYWGESEVGNFMKETSCRRSLAKEVAWAFQFLIGWSVMTWKNCFKYYFLFFWQKREQADCHRLLFYIKLPSRKYTSRQNPSDQHLIQNCQKYFPLQKKAAHAVVTLTFHWGLKWKKSIPNLITYWFTADILGCLMQTEFLSYK